MRPGSGHIATCNRHIIDNSVGLYSAVSVASPPGYATNIDATLKSKAFELTTLMGSDV